MQTNINDDNTIKLTDYCMIKGISYEEAVNNILAEFFLERQRREDNE
jgi:hypothetical protein